MLQFLATKYNNLKNKNHIIRFEEILITDIRDTFLYLFVG
jgi:hypothetical protein